MYYRMQPIDYYPERSEMNIRRVYFDILLTIVLRKAIKKTSSKFEKAAEMPILSQRLACHRCDDYTQNTTMPR